MKVSEGRGGLCCVHARQNRDQVGFVAERSYGDIRRWTEMEKGGHFAALEQPEALAREVRAFFRPLR